MTKILSLILLCLLAMGVNGQVVPPPCAPTPGITSGPFCVSSDTFHLTVDMPGGRWSGCNVTPDGVFTPTTVGTCTVIYTIDTLGCFGTDTAEITVREQQLATITGPAQVCQNAEITVQGTPTYGVFYPNDTVRTYFTGTYIYTHTAGVGCTDIDSLEITVIPFIQAAITAPAQVCQNAILTLQGFPANGTFLPNDTVNTTLPGTYTYTYTTTGCVIPDSVEIEVIGLPIANFSYAITNCEVCFIDSSLYASSYYWDYGDGSAGPDLDTCHMYPFNGTFCVTLYVTNACGSDTFTICIPLGCVGIEETKASQISIYPNPATDFITLNTGNLQNSWVELFDISGRKLLQQNGMNSLQTLDVSTLSNGVYIAVITANNKVVKREKVVVSR